MVSRRNDAGVVAIRIDVAKKLKSAPTRTENDETLLLKERTTRDTEHTVAVTVLLLALVVDLLIRNFAI